MSSDAQTVPVSRPIVYLNADGTYMDESQILADLPRRVTDDADLALMRRNFVARLDADMTRKARSLGMDVGATVRSQFGRWIRNSYGMWHESNPHWMEGRPSADGVMRDTRHPDNASGRIIEAFVAQLQSTGGPA